MVTELFLENPPGKRRARKAKRTTRRARKNGPELILFGNPTRRTKRHTRRTTAMARHRRKAHKAKVSHKRRTRRVRRHAARVNRPVRHRRVRRSRKSRRHARKNPVTIVRRMRRYRRHTGRRGRGPVRSFRTVLRNPIGAIGSFVRIPTLQELLWVSAGALALPYLSGKVKSYLPVQAQFGWGGILADFGIGMLASSGARKFAGSVGGDLLFTLVLARAVGAAAVQAFPEKFGVPVQTAPTGTVGYYDPNQLGYYEPNGVGFSGPLPGFADADAMPSMLS